MSIVLFLALACARQTAPAWCVDRSGDADCDGIADARDRCPETTSGALTDAVGCSDNQAAGCTVTLESPEDNDKLKGTGTFSWRGSCDVYLLQFSDDPGFAAGATRTADRTTATSLETTQTEEHWRVVGGLEGSARAFSTQPRRVRWR